MPISVTEFDNRQGLVLWALRLLCGDPGWACLVRCECARRLRGSDVAAVVALRGLASILVRRGRRPGAIAAPAADTLAAAERALLALIAALQWGEDTHAAALAPWLVEAGAVETLLGHAGRLARALRDAGLVLPPPAVVGAPSHPAAPSFVAIAGTGGRAVATRRPRR